jgi:hypothetical protein
MKNRHYGIFSQAGVRPSRQRGCLKLLRTQDYNKKIENQNHADYKNGDFRHTLKPPAEPGIKKTSYEKDDGGNGVD